MTDVTNLWIRQSAIPPLMRSSQSQWKPQRGTRNALIERYFLISALSFHELARESMQEWLIFSPIGSLMLCVQRWRQWCDLHTSAGSFNCFFQNLIGISSKKKKSWSLCWLDSDSSVVLISGNNNQRAVGVFTARGRGRQIKSPSPRNSAPIVLLVIRTSCLERNVFCWSHTWLLPHVISWSAFVSQLNE